MPGSKIREAREARLMSRDELAEKANTTRQLIYRYETGAVAPRAETLVKLSLALNVSPDFFFMEPPAPEPSLAFFRHFSSKTSAKEYAATERQFLWVREIVRHLEELVILPPLDVPDFSAPSDPREITNAQIDEAATALRRHWKFGDGVIPDLVKLVESKGCIVVSGLVSCDSIDAFSRTAYKGRPFIVVSFHDTKGPRRRIDVAHELGHLVLHRNIDKRFFQRNPGTHDLIEAQAFRFGSAFMLPEPTFRRSIPFVTLDTLLLAKPLWHISVAAMLYRAKDLGMVNEVDAKRHWANLNRRGWRKEEPFDELVPLEKPQLLANAFRTVRDNGANGLQALCGRVGLYPPDLERYAGMEPRELEIGPVGDFQLSLREERKLNHA